MTINSSGDDASRALDNLTLQTRNLEVGANGFAKAMTSAFATSIVGGKQFDDVLKSLTLRLSSISLNSALAPVTKMLSAGIDQLLAGLTGSRTAAVRPHASGGVKPFASGGVIGTPTYFPMMDGGVGLAGEAGPEAIMPLARGADGRLGVSGSGGGNNISIQIAASDLESFRRSESYITGQIARAVGRGQRSL